MPLLLSGAVLETVELGRVLLLADTHVGFEFELAIRGIRVPRQTRRIVEHYISLAQRERADAILIAGDVKHEIPIALETAKEVREFLSNVADYIEKVVLVQGNHDGGLDKIVEKISKKNIVLYDTRGIILTTSDKKNVLILHGNAKPRPQAFLKADILVIGHTHPAVVLRDALGYTVREPVFVKAKVQKKRVFMNMYRKDEVKDLQVHEDELSRDVTLVILPCANPLITGTDITRTLLQRQTTTKTIVTYFELWSCLSQIEVFLTDFTYLGTLDMLLNIEHKIVATKERVDWDFL